MQRLDLTFSQPAMNLALDEALLEQAEANDWNFDTDGGELIRFWEPETHFVVLGRSSVVADEVNLNYCQARAIPVFRRVSGGATILTGPGCLMYAVRLSYKLRPKLRMLDQAHQFVMGQMKAAIGKLGSDVHIAGTSDLVYQNKKVSGNSLRCRRGGLIYHGTLICDLDLKLIADCLKQPARQPEYRQGRDHRAFLTQLPFSTETLKEAIAKQFQAVDKILDCPMGLCERLAREKYQLNSWNLAR